MKSQLKKIALLRAVHSACKRCAENVNGYVHMLMMRARARRQVVPEAEIVVSLTTYHARLHDFHITLESLLRQDIRVPYAINVHLSDADLDDGVLPESLQRLSRHGIVFTIHTANMRSYKKLMYEYRPNSSRIIVTADDDVIYPKYWLRQLYESHLKHPDSVVAFRAHFLRLQSEETFAPYKDMMKSKAKTGARLTPRFDLIPTGVSGVLYPPNSLDPLAVESTQFMKLAPTADDIWFKVASLKKGTRCVQVRDRNIAFAFVPHSQDGGALHEENVARGKNDVQLSTCFQAFPELYDLIPTRTADTYALPITAGVSVK